MANQQIHLWPVRPDPGPLAAGALPPVVRLPAGPALLPPDVGEPQLTDTKTPPSRGAVVVEPIFNQRKQLRLLAWFSEAATPQVNGEPAPRVVLLEPGDHLQWGLAHSFRVLLFNKPLIGPPPASVRSKQCPVCRTPFTADAVTVTCTCGVVLHCDPDEKEGLQCAQLRRECPACRRPIVLTEGYVNPPSHED